MSVSFKYFSQSMACRRLVLRVCFSEQKFLNFNEVPLTNDFLKMSFFLLNSRFSLLYDFVSERKRGRGGGSQGSFSGWRLSGARVGRAGSPGGGLAGARAVASEEKPARGWRKAGFLVSGFLMPPGARVPGWALQGPRAEVSASEPVPRGRTIAQDLRGSAGPRRLFPSGVAPGAPEIRVALSRLGGRPGRAFAGSLWRQDVRPSILELPCALPAGAGSGPGLRDGRGGSALRVRGRRGPGPGRAGGGADAWDEAAGSPSRTATLGSETRQRRSAARI